MCISHFVNGEAKAEGFYPFDSIGKTTAMRPYRQSLLFLRNHAFDISLTNEYRGV